MRGHLTPKLVGSIAISLVSAGTLIAIALGHSPFVTKPAMPSSFGLSGDTLLAASLVLGAIICALVIAITRALPSRFEWAKDLARVQRARFVNASDAEIVITAALVGTAEELFFRGFLMTVFGVVISSIAFGLVHQTRGRARIYFMLGAAALGFVFAGVFRLTGSLAGPILAHIAINAANARNLRDHHAAPKPRALGGLLQRRS